MSFSSVEHAEEAGTRRETGSLDDLQASVVLRTPYANRYTLFTDLLTGGTGGIGRAWPFSSAGDGLTASTVTIVGSGVTDTGATANKMAYEDALLTVNYTTGTTDLIAEELEPTIEFRTLDHRQFRWSSGDIVLEGETPGRQFRGLNIVRTHFRVSALNASLVNLVGSVNSLGHTSNLLPMTFAAETLLYTPPAISRTIAIGDGADLFTVKTRYGYKPEGWNKFWRPETQTYERLVHANTGLNYNNFPLNDLTPTFTLPKA